MLKLTTENQVSAAVNHALVIHDYLQIFSRMLWRKMHQWNKLKKVRFEYHFIQSLQVAAYPNWTIQISIPSRYNWMYPNFDFRFQSHFVDFLPLFSLPLDIAHPKFLDVYVEPEKFNHDRRMILIHRRHLCYIGTRVTDSITFKLLLRFRKAGSVWCGGARETGEPRHVAHVSQ